MEPKQNGKLKEALVNAIRYPNIPIDERILLMLAALLDTMNKLERIEAAVDDTQARMEHIEKSNEEYPPISYYWRHKKKAFVGLLIFVALFFVSETRHFMIDAIRVLIDVVMMLIEAPS